MGRRFESPVKHFPGFVEIKEPIPYADVCVWEDAIDALNEKYPPKEDEDGKRLPTWSFRQFYRAAFPALFPCVEKWNIIGLPENVTVQTFPGTPANAREQLIAWLVECVSKVYKGNEDNDPNG
jgi:hypothetical protein